MGIKRTRQYRNCGDKGNRDPQIDMMSKLNRDFAHHYSSKPNIRTIARWNEDKWRDLGMWGEDK